MGNEGALMSGVTTDFKQQQDFQAHISDLRDFSEQVRNLDDITPADFHSEDIQIKRLRHIASGDNEEFEEKLEQAEKLFPISGFRKFGQKLSHIFNSIPVPKNLSILAMQLPQLSLLAANALIPLNIPGLLMVFILAPINIVTITSLRAEQKYQESFKLAKDLGIKNLSEYNSEQREKALADYASNPTKKSKALIELVLLKTNASQMMWDLKDSPIIHLLLQDHLHYSEDEVQKYAKKASQELNNFDKSTQNLEAQIENKKSDLAHKNEHRAKITKLLHDIGINAEAPQRQPTAAAPA